MVHGPQSKKKRGLCEGNVWYMDHRARKGVACFRAMYGTWTTAQDCHRVTTQLQLTNVSYHNFCRTVFPGRLIAQVAGSYWQFKSFGV